MGKSIPLTSIMAPSVAGPAQQGINSLQTLAAANSIPTTPGPAKPLPHTLTVPTSLDDAKKRIQDAFTTLKVMNAARKGDGQSALDALNGRQ